MSKYLHCGKWDKNYYYILYTSIFAFFTYYIFGYTFNGYLDEIKIFANLNEKNNHIIINYIFRYLGLILFSLTLYKYESRPAYNDSEENTKNHMIISFFLSY